MKLRLRRRCPAYMLIEAVVYCVVAMIFVAVAYSALYFCTESGIALRANADDIATALHVGERWRADVRSARGQIRVERTAAEPIVHLGVNSGDVAYQFQTNAVLRRVGSGAWTVVLPKVKSSTMEADARPNVTAWRWDLELQPRSKKPPRVKPLFTFLAAPERGATR